MLVRRWTEHRDINVVHDFIIGSRLDDSKVIKRHLFIRKPRDNLNNLLLGFVSYHLLLCHLRATQPVEGSKLLSSYFA